MENKNLKTEYNKIIAKFIELSIWFLFSALIVTGIVIYNSYSHKHFHRYQIFLQDVDGIIEGSPVRMLGIQVGYVKHIKFVNDMVYIDFIITQKDMIIPKGSKITVEFSGLGGSKSLEIYTPKDKVYESVAPLYIQQPRRLGATLSLLDDMFEKLGEIKYKFTSFAKQLEASEIKSSASTANIDKKDFLNKTDKWLDKRLEEQNKKKNRK